MNQRPVGIHRGGPPETVLDPPSAEEAQALADALGQSPEDQRDALSAVVARWPRSCDAWSQLAHIGRDPIERYAAYRVGYHRGLDQLRGAGWRGTGLVRWAEPTNRGFLRSVAGLGVTAAEIGEADEAERCSIFLRQLDTQWPPDDLDPHLREQR